MLDSVNPNYCGETHCCIRPEKFDGTNFKPGLKPTTSKPQPPKAQEAYPGEKKELEEKLVKMLEIMKAAQTHISQSAQKNGKNFVTINYGAKFEQEVLKTIMRLEELNGVQKPKFPPVMYNYKPQN